nr:reverse transcriptase domain-containing protein [Tanacetum cinerariifolium]
MGRGGKQNNRPHKGKVINMVQCHSHDRKRKTTMTDEKWMNVPITFPPVLARDISEEALVVEGKVEGYLVRRIHVDEGASIEIMFEQCFNMLHPSIRARLVETQTTVLGFSREQVKHLGKIKLDVCFGGSGMCQREIMKFTIISTPSPYNIILGRLGLKQLRSITSTIHGMMKFLTLWGIATLVSKVLVNHAYSKQLAVIRKGLLPEGSTQLKNLLKKNKDIFAWEPSDMTGVLKGYHQVQMEKEDEEKTTFYTDQAQENDPAHTDSNNHTSEGNPAYILSSIERSSQCSVNGGKKRKAVSGALRGYNITYEPRSAIKGQILADFINKVPVGSDTMVPQRTTYTVDHQKDCKDESVLYTDEASSVKGSSAVLVLISLTKIEYTYDLRIKFESTNNQAEYEAPWKD